MRETGRLERTITGTPQGGIVSPLLANIALTALDRRYAGGLGGRMSRLRQGSPRVRCAGMGRPTYRLVRYADDLVVLRQGDAGAGRSAARASSPSACRSTRTCS